MSIELLGLLVHSQWSALIQYDQPVTFVSNLIYVCFFAHYQKTVYWLIDIWFSLLSICVVYHNVKNKSFEVEPSLPIWLASVVSTLVVICYQIQNTLLLNEFSHKNNTSLRGWLFKENVVEENGHYKVVENLTVQPGTADQTKSLLGSNTQLCSLHSHREFVSFQSRYLFISTSCDLVITAISTNM